MQSWGFIKGFKNTQPGRSFYALSVPLILNCADWTMHFFEPFLCTFYLTNTHYPEYDSPERLQIGILGTKNNKPVIEILMGI